MRNPLIIGAVLIVLAGVFLVSGYNGIVSRRENITAQWAQVENQLQRRNDLIPNLVSTVKGYASHEKTLFEDITRARSQWQNAATVKEKVNAASAVDSALSRILAIAENYPVLKADGAFLKLMDELAGTENRIAVERMRFNDAVRQYNTAVRMFPGNVLAGMFGFQPASEYLKTQDGAAAVPAVKF